MEAEVEPRFAQEAVVYLVFHPVLISRENCASWPLYTAPTHQTTQDFNTPWETCSYWHSSDNSSGRVKQHIPRQVPSGHLRQGHPLLGGKTFF